MQPDQLANKRWRIPPLATLALRNICRWMIGWLRRFALPRAVARACRRLGRSLRPHVCVIEGIERTTRKPLALLFHGQLENKNYLAHLIFGDNGSEKVFRVWSWRVHRLASDPNARHAIAIIERTRLPRNVPPGTFYIPCWIGGEIELAEAEHRRRHSGNVKEDLRRIRKSGFDIVTERSPEHIYKFYDEMYVPYVRAVYGSRAFLVSRTELDAMLSKAELLLVCRHNEPVAGQIILYEGARARAWLTGVKDGDRRYVRDGAIAAIYHFGTRLLATRGFERVHAGASRAFLNDGVLRYKSKWGLRITNRAPTWFRLSLVRSSEAVTAFLATNPFLFEVSERFYGAVFADSINPRPPDAWLDTFKLTGMAGMVTFRHVYAAGGAGCWNTAAFRSARQIRAPDLTPSKIAASSSDQCR